MTPLEEGMGMEMSEFKTLEQFIIEQQQSLSQSTGAFSRLLRDISVAAKIVNRGIRRAGLINIFGATGEVNVQGEVQQKLDLMAHTEFVRALKRGGECCLIGSEEHAEAIPLNTSTRNSEGSGRYIVLMDPLDGSSNIDVNVSVGTIVSIYELPEGSPATMEHALQPGLKQVAALYVVYGSSTMLVYTTGHGVNGFTLEPSIGEFLLSHPNITTPKTGTLYSINEGNYNSFERGLKSYIKWMQSEADTPKRPYSTRYIGSFVSDFHRNLLKGGIYIYPVNDKNPEGKLRLMYEANPLAFIVEQAGGCASDGYQPILQKTPKKLHQRTALYIGSELMVRRAEGFLQGHLTVEEGTLPEDYA